MSETKNSVWNKQRTLGSRIALLVSGIIIMILAYFWYVQFYALQNVKDSINDLWAMMMCSVVIVLGFVLCVINFNMENQKVKNVMWIMFGMLIAGNFFNKHVRALTVLLLVAGLIFLLTVRFKNIFSTIVTMWIGLVIVTVIMVIIQKICLDINESLLIYLVISTYFALYRIFGVKINRSFIGSVMGYKKDAMKYDTDQLVNQITLMYLGSFVVFSIMIYLNNMNSQVFNLLNGSFLTGLTINQINWNEILFYFKKSVK